MKFLSFVYYDIAKLGQMAEAADKLAKNPPEGYKILGLFSCQSNPFPGVALPPDRVVMASVIECETAEALAAAALPYKLNGAEVTRTPIMDITPGGAADLVNRIKL